MKCKQDVENGAGNVMFAREIRERAPVQQYFVGASIACVAEELSFFLP